MDSFQMMSTIQSFLRGIGGSADYLRGFIEDREGSIRALVAAKALTELAEMGERMEQLCYFLADEARSSGGVQLVFADDPEMEEVAN